MSTNKLFATVAAGAVLASIPAALAQTKVASAPGKTSAPAVSVADLAGMLCRGYFKGSFFNGGASPDQMSAGFMFTPDAKGEFNFTGKRGLENANNWETATGEHYTVIKDKSRLARLNDGTLWFTNPAGNSTYTLTPDGTPDHPLHFKLVFKASGALDGYPGEVDCKPKQK